jgi:DNA-directed RNA polymerase subunit L
VVAWRGTIKEWRPRFPATLADAGWRRRDAGASNQRFETLKRRTSESRGMDLRVIEKGDAELTIEIAGENHTFMNVLKGALLETDGVVAASYDVNPEQSGGQTEPLLTIKTDEGTDPLDALRSAANRTGDELREFADTFEATV